MACSVQVYSPITGEYIDSQAWNDINNEIRNSELADTLFAQTRAEGFKSWFGDIYNQGEAHSQVLTESGEPLLVFDLGNGQYSTAQLEDESLQPMYLNLRNVIEGVPGNTLEEKTQAFFEKGILSDVQTEKILNSNLERDLITELGSPDGYYYDQDNVRTYVSFDQKNAKSLYSKPELTLANLKQQGYYTSIPDNVLGVLARNSVLSRVNNNLGDRWYFVRGLNDQLDNIQDNLRRYHQFMSMNNLNQDMFIFDNTQEDQAPFLTTNPNFNFEDTIAQNDTKIQKEKYEAIVQHFVDKFGINKDKIVYTTKADFAKQFPNTYKENMQSVYHNGKFYFFTRNLTSDVTVEELLHPFIYTVKDLNLKLYNNLLKEAQRNYPKLNAQIQGLYGDKSKDIRGQELVTQALSRVFNNVYENEEPKSFLDTIKEFVNWIREVMNNIFSDNSTGKNINVPIDKLDPQTSMYEISKLLNATDTQFDIVYADNTMYSLENNNDSFNRVIEKILTDQRVATKVNEILVKLPETIKNIKNKLNDTINENEKKNLSGILQNIKELETEENQNIIAFQLKGIIASVQLSNELLKNLNAMDKSDNDDNIKLSYYMSVFKTAKAMDSFKELIIDLRDELTSNLVLSNTKDVNTFIGMLETAISSEDKISHKIQKLVKAPLLAKLVESTEFSYQPQIDEVTKKIDNIESEISKTASQAEKDKLFNKLVSLRKQLKSIQDLAPTKENLEKILNGAFKDANVLSHIFESKIANGNPLVATLQSIVNDIYDSAGRNMLQYKNEAQNMMDDYSKATGFGLRDMEKRYEQIRDIVAIPTEILLKEGGLPDLDDEGKFQFKYTNQDTLLSNIDNSYLTQYLQLEMVKNFYYDKHRENVANNAIEESTYNDYRAALDEFQTFIKDNAQQEYTQEIYDFKAILNEEIGGKTLREITSNMYHELDQQETNMEAARDSEERAAITERIKDINIELKRLRTEFHADGTKKTGDDLKIAELLTKYNKLRSEYYESNLSDSARQRFEFDKAELEKKKQQYIDNGNEETYNRNLAKIQQEVISPDYFSALASISGEINELSNVLADIANKALTQYINKDIFKQQKTDVYEEIRELAKPYRDENGVIDGPALLARHPEIGLKIRDLQQYIEDLRYETGNIAKLSQAERDELKLLRENQGRDLDQENRYNNLIDKQKAFSNFKKENDALLKQLGNLYTQLGDLTTTYTTDYYDKALEAQIEKEKAKPEIRKQAIDFIKNNTRIQINGVIFEKGPANLDPNIWYQEQVTGKKITHIPMNSLGETGYQEIVDATTGYLAQLSIEETDWWKNNHYSAYRFDEKLKVYTKVDRPIYIWEHTSPKNPNFIETKPAKSYYKYTVKSQFINREFNTTYRGIPMPKQGKFVNERYGKLDKSGTVFQFLDYFTKEYLNDQAIYDLKGNSVKNGFVLPSIIKTSGENQVNLTNKVLSFDGTFAEMFKVNARPTDTDTSYLVGGGQANSKTIPIRFVGKMDTKTQTKNIVASLLLFKYHTSLYKALNDSLPVFESSQLLAANVDVLESKNYADRLSFTKKMFNLFSSKKSSKEEELRVKNIEKSVLSKSVDDILDIFVYGQRMKPQVLNLGPLGSVDLAKVSSSILGVAAKSIFIGNVFSAINNSLSTRLQVIINSGLKSNLYTLNNIKNAQAIAPKYTKDLFSDWTKLGNKSLIGQTLDFFSFMAENPSREITSKSEFTMLKNKMEFLTSPKQMSEYEVLFLQFMTMADATPVMINGVESKLSKVEDIFEIKDGKFQMKPGVVFTNEQQKKFRGRYQSLARKVAGAYRTTEISSIETNWAGKSGMFLRRYFVAMATNRFQGERFSIQDGDTYMGYQREVIRNLGKLFKEYKGNMPKYWDQLSDREKASHTKMLFEYGLLLVMMGLFSMMGGNDDKKDLKKNSWAYNVQLIALMRAKSELQQFTLVGIDDLIRIGKNPFMAFQTLGTIQKILFLVPPTLVGDESAFYQQDSGLHKKGDRKITANFLKLIGYTGVTFKPEEYIVNFRNAQNR